MVRVLPRSDPGERPRLTRCAVAEQDQSYAVAVDPAPAVAPPSTRSDMAMRTSEW